MRGDEVGMDPEAKQAQAVREIMLPNRLVPFLEVFSPPEVVDQNVEPTVLGSDRVAQLPPLFRPERVRLYGDSLPAGSRDQLGRFLYGFRAAVLGLLRPRGASGDIDRRARGPQLDRA